MTFVKIKVKPSKMLQQQFCLETLQYILSQFSEDITKDYSRVVAKSLKALGDLTSNESVHLHYKNTFASVKILLNLYEKLHPNSSDINSQLPLTLIIQGIKSLLECSNENCNLPDNVVQCDILLIVSWIFNYELLQKYPHYLEELTEFYEYTLSCLSPSKADKGCKSDCLIFKIKIMDSIYQSCAKVANDMGIVQFYEKLNLKNSLKECQFFAHLVLHDNEKIAIETLMHLIPRYIICCNSDKILEIIWEQISKSETHSGKTSSRVYIILCNFFDMFIDKSLLRKEVGLTLLLLEDINYWKLVQSALVERDPVKRKQGLYLLRKTLDFLRNTHANITCGKEKIIFYWDACCKDELYKIYSDVITSLEFLEEQQVHIIKPIFKMVETLMNNITEYGKVDISWILLIYQKSLMHESSQIVKWGLDNLLSLPKSFLLFDCIARKIAMLLVTTLNNIDLYYDEGLAISQKLKIFFKEVVQLSSGKNFFCLFIKEVCSQVWSAEALFFVMHSLSNIGKFSFWGKKEISMIRTFVSKAFKTHNKIIRIGIQHELLNTILGFTDEKDVPLENLIILFSSFSACAVFWLEHESLNKLAEWLYNSYPKEEVQNTLEKYKKQKLGKEFNEKCISFMLILFYYSYVCYSPENDFISKEGTCLIINYLVDIFSSFKETSKRLYCDKSLCDQYLSIISYVYEMSSRIKSFIEPTLPFVSDVILYIQTQFRQISSLKDFNTFQLYLKTFDNIISTLILFKIDVQLVNNMYLEISKDLEMNSYPSSDISSVWLYCRMKVFSILLRSCHLKLKPSFWASYLLERVNESLKENDHSAKTRDLQTLWGKINSEFLEDKWKILEYMISTKLINYGSVGTETSFWISNDALLSLCNEALDRGGYGVLCPVMSVLKNLLFVLENDVETRKIIDSVWKLIMERRKTEEFKLFIRQFVEMLFQEAFILRGKLSEEILSEYSNLIFSDSSLAVINIFMKHVQQINLLESSTFLFCHIIGKGLIFGPVKKKYEKLTDRVCSHIKSLKIYPVEEMSYYTSNEIRARAVLKIFTLDHDSAAHQTAAKNLIKVLLKMENEINKNRSRHFNNSHVHLVKNRLFQALLLLEPMLSPDESEAKELWDWVYNCMMNDDSQPSVRYLQEWLCVRLLLRHPELYRQFSLFNNRCMEIKKKGLCSLFSVTFHLCKLIQFHLMEAKIFDEISSILPFCFHHNFEVRLYAQLTLLKLYDFAKEKNLGKITKEYECLCKGLWISLSENSKGNFGTNFFELSENFYFSDFNPLEDYSLQTIYMDLPKLANVSSEEWISTEMFQFCGVNSQKIGIHLNNPRGILGDFDWRVNKLFSNNNAFTPAEFKENIFGNYQKKLIPIKLLTPVWDDGSSAENTLKKDGLVVVASLIDRIPNLGGLARTCEIFGASEYIISSLKYTEDKQFTSLSVTAEKWVTIREVKIQHLFDYISNMKQSGYTVIGAEQTLYSQPLGSVKFPKKSLFLLGNEKEGIPPNLLHVLDLCVEVPQLGIIRSLNVHVTGALFIWEYAKQNHFS